MSQILAQDSNDIIRPVLCDTTGKLQIDLTGADGTASSSNQELQLAQETSTATSVDSIDTKTPSQYGNSQVLLTSAGGTAVKSDSDCLIQADTENRKGWQLTNPVVNTKFNLYYFNGAQETITLGDVLSIYAVGSVNVNSETNSVPFFHIYTKPTGVNDQAIWYHSKIDYIYNNDNTIGIGEDCVFYGEGEPSSNFSQRKIQFNNKVVNGEGLPAEEVLYMVCASNSGATVNSKNITLNTMGFNTALLARNLKLEVEAAQGGGGATETTLNDFKTDNATNLGTIDSSIGDVATNQTNGNQKSMCMGFDGTSQVQLKCDANGVLETSGGGGGGDATADNQTNGNQLSRVMGDSSGTQVQLKCDNNGTLNVNNGFYAGHINKGDINAIIGAGAAEAYLGIYNSMSVYSRAVIFGNTTNTTDKIYVNYGKTGGGTFYKDWENPINIDPATGDFFMKLTDLCVPMWKLSKENSTGVDETIKILISLSQGN